MSDELPPNSSEAEMGVVGCLLADPPTILPELAHVRPDAFFDLRNREIFNICNWLQANSKPVEQLSILNRAKELGIDFGGLDYLNKCEQSTPSAANLDYFREEMLEKHTRRRIINACDIVSGWANNGKKLDELMSGVQRLSEIEPPKKKAAIDGAASGLRMIDDLERRHNLKGELSGLDTGYYSLNRLTEGIQFGEQTLIGSRPSMGKTAIGLNIFQHQTLNKKTPSLFVSLEMSTEALMRRMLSAWSGIPLADIRRGSYSQDDFSKFMAFQSAVKNSPLYILDAVSGISIHQLCYEIQAHVKKHGTKLVVIDYLQKIKPSEKKEKRTYEVAEVSERLKATADKTKAAFLTLAQLNRESETGKGQPPKMSDLADSGQIERDSDTIALIHRDRNDQQGKTRLLIVKQRDGSVGCVELQFDGEHCRFLNPSLPTQNETD